MPAIHLTKIEAQKMGIKFPDYSKPTKQKVIKIKAHKVKAKHSARLFSFAKYKGNRLLKRLI